jgi:hypothetical protein
MVRITGTCVKRESINRVEEKGKGKKKGKFNYKTESRPH